LDSATLAGPGLILALLLPRASLRATGAAADSTPWPLRACALLLAAYAFLAAFVAVEIIAALVGLVGGFQALR
jgi:hypothetical protein